MQTDRLLLGRPPQGGAGRFGLNTDRHLITVAPAGTGKSVGVLVPNLLTNLASAVVTDPKGELAAVTAHRRLALGQRVVLLNPWGLHGLPTDAFNPMAAIDPEGPRLVPDVRAIANALVVSEGEDDTHWDREARALIEAMLLHMATTRPAYGRNLLLLRAWLLSAPDELDRLLEDMQANRAAGGVVSRAANRILQKEDRERSGVFSTAHGHTDFLEDPALACGIDRSTFDPRELKTGRMTVYLMLPATELRSQSRWLRLVVSQLLLSLQLTPGSPPLPVTFYLDEAAALGRLEDVRDAYAIIRGYGGRMWTFWQDLSQIRRLYGKDNWSTFIANSGVAQFFAMTDDDTARLVSQMLGRSTVVASGFNAGHKGLLGENGDGTNNGKNWSATGRELMTPDELRQLPADEQILMIQGHPPFRVPKLNYLRDADFRGLAEANPLHRAA